MASDWTDWADGSDLAGISRSTDPLSRAGYDPDDVRADPALRKMVMQSAASPYGLSLLQAAGIDTSNARPGTATPQPIPNAPVTAPRMVPAVATPAPAAPAGGVGNASTAPRTTATMPTATSAQPSGSLTQPDLDDYAREALGKELNLGDTASQMATQMANAKGPDTSALDARIANDAAPTPYRDPKTGGVLPSAEQYKPTGWQEFGRGLKSAAIGLVTGGIPGAVVGALEPEDIRGGKAYGAPNRAYDVTETQRQNDLTAAQNQRTNLLQAFKDATDQRKQTFQLVKDAAGAENDVLTGTKNLEQQQTNRDKNSTALRKAGFKQDDQGNIVPLDASEMSPEQKAKADLDEASESLKEAQTAFEKERGDPRSPAFQQAQERLSLAQQRLQLSTRQYLMHAYGTDVNGQALPGAMELPSGTPVGTANAANVRPTATQRDAAGRAQTMDELGTRIEAALNDPEIRRYMGPLGGRLAESEQRLGTLPPKVAQFWNDLKSYGAFQAGMHPVRGIGGLEYFDKVMGGLAQTPDQLAGKLKSNRATAHSVENVGTPRVAGAGNAPAATPPAAGGGSDWFAQHPKATTGAQQ